MACFLFCISNSGDIFMSSLSPEARKLLDEWSVKIDSKLPNYWRKAKNWIDKANSFNSDKANKLECFAEFALVAVKKAQEEAYKKGWDESFERTKKRGEILIKQTEARVRVEERDKAEKHLNSVVKLCDKALLQERRETAKEMISHIRSSYGTIIDGLTYDVAIDSLFEELIDVLKNKFLSNRGQSDGKAIK